MLNSASCIKEDNLVLTAEPKVLVVGTTPDYVECIRQLYPERAVFLTEPGLRRKALEPVPLDWEELLLELEDFTLVKHDLARHLRQWELSLDGIVCFDCESMELAALLAKDLSLNYPHVDSIRQCRDKYISKKIWQENGVSCPRNRLVQSSNEVYDFMQTIGGACVIKPLSGSGSELVFHCRSREDCENGAKNMAEGLRARQTHRLYSSRGESFLAEEFVCGQEYSCDFIHRESGVQILRLTKKIKDSTKPFGTITAYQLSDCETEGLDKNGLECMLNKGAEALHIGNAVCMVDFLVADGVFFLLEMTPRPGGDCIPSLLQEAVSFNMLGFALDCAQKRPCKQPDPAKDKFVALRLHASSAGTIRQIDTSALGQDPRVQSVMTLRQPGHQVVMPPQDYDSWYLGHLIFKPAPEDGVEGQCEELSKKVVVEMAHDNSSRL